MDLTKHKTTIVLAVMIALMLPVTILTFRTNQKLGFLSYASEEENFAWVWFDPQEIIGQKGKETRVSIYAEVSGTRLTYNSISVNLPMTDNVAYLNPNTEFKGFFLGKKKIGEITIKPEAAGEYTIRPETIINANLKLKITTAPINLRVFD